MRHLLFSCLLLGFGAGVFAKGGATPPPLPTEYVTSPGMGMGLLNSGVAAFSGIEGIQINPALMANQKQYTFNAGYFWPGDGREFYQAGILDSKTSSFAAAVNYSSFLDDFDPEEYKTQEIDDQGDSLLKRRIRFGLAQKFDLISMGVSGQMVEAHEYNKETQQFDSLKGISINAGITGSLSDKIRYGLSAENLNNDKIKDYAPQTYRLGFAYIYSPELAMHVDYKQREDRYQYEADILEVELEELNPQKTAIASFVARVYQMVRLMAAYGTDLDEKTREASGGVVVVSNTVTLSYMARKPDLNLSKTEQSVNIGFDIRF